MTSIHPMMGSFGWLLGKALFLQFLGFDDSVSSQETTKNWTEVIYVTGEGSNLKGIVMRSTYKRRAAS